MSTVLPAAESLPVVLPYQPMRMSVADYHKLIACGTLTENHRIELLKGVLTEKMTHNPLHAGVIWALQTLLLPFLPAGYLLRCQLPITLQDSEPEPDIAIVRGDFAEFFKRHPSPGETPFVAEISSSSLLTDRFKGEIYAEAGIPVYWIVNLVNRRVEIHTAPTSTAEGFRYANCRQFLAGDSIPVVLDDRDVGAVPAARLLPEVVE